MEIMKNPQDQVKNEALILLASRGKMMETYFTLRRSPFHSVSLLFCKLDCYQLLPRNWEEDELGNPIGFFDWVLYSLRSELVLRGSVESANGENVPWFCIRDYIESVVVLDGVVSICYGAFCLCAQLNSVHISRSVTPSEMKRLLFAIIWGNQNPRLSWFIQRESVHRVRVTERDWYLG